MTATMYEDTWKEVWEKLPVVPFEQNDKGEIRIFPYTSESQKHIGEIAHCRKIIRDYKIVSFKRWGGNGIGHISKLFMWDTRTNDMRSLADVGTFTFISRRMMVYCAKGPI